MAEEFGSLDSLLIEDDFFFDFDLPFFTEQSSPDSADSWIGEIENQLMNDENNQNDQEKSFPELDQQSVSEFLADIFVDYPTSDDSTHVVVDSLETDKVVVEIEGSEKKKVEVLNDSGSEGHDGAKPESEIEGNDDVVAKKRTRQLRNRDAAVRSRERKKEYVQDLEKKSKYLERECMRLGRMLDCFAAENHSLRLCLQSSGNNNASTTKSKQESAVLLLESLLLGSLLWFLGSIICPFPLTRETKCYLPSLLVTPREPEKPVLNGLGRSSRQLYNNGKCRSCKGSRPRMKHQIVKIVA
ncbi:unnamed protein product [Cochlearia groenlandica]